jgi:thymidylate kinase
MNKENKKLIMFAGPSGIGKTTLAKGVEELYSSQSVDIPFISGSVSDLVESTREMSHKDMLNRDSMTLQMEDYQILNLRKKKFSNQIASGKNFVCDRSFLDSAAYFIYKQAEVIAKCEVEHFLALSKLLSANHCTHLILLDFTPNMIQEWVTENNNKRITNNYFQMEIARIMNMVLDLWGIRYTEDIFSLKGKNIFSVPTSLKYGAKRGIIDSPYGKVNVLVIRESVKEIREKLIERFIDGKI